MTAREEGRRHGRWLWLALGAFVVRVVAQPAARLLDAPLPAAFHLVIASYPAVYARYHVRAGHLGAPS